MKVTATIDGVTNNGQRYAAGEVFDMEDQLVGPHEQAGQVKRVAAGNSKAKQAKTPRDKQATGGKNK